VASSLKPLRLARRTSLWALLASSFLLAVPLAATAATPEHALVGISDPAATGPTPGLLEAFAPRWRAAGVDVVSVSANWREIAPGQDAKIQPAGFNAADPNSSLYNWVNLDRVISVLRANKLEPLLTVTGPGPLWASGDPERGISRYRPSPAAFAEFSASVAARYRGSVGRYIIWDEPNDPSRLTPQSYCSKKVCSPRSPEIYRNLFNAGESAIRANDEEADIYAGALAARGSDPKLNDDPIRPVPWLRAFGCIDRGGSADRTSSACRSFQAPVINGLAFHPDQRGQAPIKRLRSTFEVGISDTRRLTTVLDAVQASGGLVNGSDVGAPVDLYYSEWGYQTNPPDIFSGVTLPIQSRWLQEGAKIVYSQPRVKLLSQYLWRDEPIRDLGQGVDAYAGGQSGLYGFDGVAKPAALSFPHPFSATSPSGSRRANLWGQVRPGGAHSVSIERQIGKRRYRQVAQAETDAQGYFKVVLPLGTTARFRYSWKAGSSSASRRFSDSMTVKLR